MDDVQWTMKNTMDINIHLMKMEIGIQVKHGSAIAVKNTPNTEGLHQIFMAIIRSDLIVCHDTPSNLYYKTKLNRQLNCRSLRCSWSIACRRCSNYIFILDLTSGFKVFSKTVWEYFKCRDWVCLILETWQYLWWDAASHDSVTAWYLEWVDTTWRVLRYAGTTLLQLVVPSCEAGRSSLLVM